MKSFFPKLWGGPNAVGEGKLRALEMTDAPYQTSSGPGFIARKKGMFREVESLPGDDVRLKFRISDIDPATAGYYSPTATVTAVPHARPSIMLKLRKKSGKTDVVGAQRSDTPYMHTINWVSADKKTVVSWRARSRYVAPDRPQYGADNSVAENGLPGAFSSWYSYGLLTQSYATPYGSAIWVNGRKYVTPYLVVGACVVRLAGTDGVVKDFLKVVAWDFWQPFGAATLGPWRYIVCPLELAGQTSGTDYSAYDLRPGLQALGATGSQCDAPFLFNASGTKAVCSRFASQLSPVEMSCPGTAAPTFSIPWPIVNENVGQFIDQNIIQVQPANTTDERQWYARRETVAHADFVIGTDLPATATIETVSNRTFTAANSTTYVQPGGGGPVTGSLSVSSYSYQQTDTTTFKVGSASVEYTSTFSLSGNSTYATGDAGNTNTASYTNSSSGIFTAGLSSVDLRHGLFHHSATVRGAASVSGSGAAAGPGSITQASAPTGYPTGATTWAARLEQAGGGLSADLPAVAAVGYSQGLAQDVEAAVDPATGSVVYAIRYVGEAFQYLRSKCFFYSPQDGSTTLLADSEVAGPMPKGGVPDDGKRHAYLHICYAHNSKDGA